MTARWYDYDVFAPVWQQSVVVGKVVYDAQSTAILIFVELNTDRCNLELQLQRNLCLAHPPDNFNQQLSFLGTAAGQGAGFGIGPLWGYGAKAVGMGLRRVTEACVLGLVATSSRLVGLTRNRIEPELGTALPSSYNTKWRTPGPIAAAVRGLRPS